MKLREIVAELDLQVLTGAELLDVEVTGGYVADLLSCVMAGADAGEIWVTLQTHANIVAVASLLNVAGIIIAEGAVVPADTIAKASQQKVVILSSAEPVYETVAHLVGLGV